MNEPNQQLRTSALVMRLMGWGIIVAGADRGTRLCARLLLGGTATGISSPGPGTSPVAVCWRAPVHLHDLFDLPGVGDPADSRCERPQGCGVAVRLGHSRQCIARVADGDQAFAYPNEHAHLWADIPLLFAISAVMWYWHPNRRISDGV